MFVQGNLVGFGMFIVGGVIAAIGSLVLRLPNAPVMITIGLALIVIDLVLRFVNRNRQGWLTQKQYGGYLFFAPVWVFGIIVVLANVINLFANPRP